MLGSFNEEAQEVWDFVRCMRADGTYYGTAGKCRKGSETGAKKKEALAKATPKQLEKLQKSPKATPAQKKALGKAIEHKKAKAAPKPVAAKKAKAPKKSGKKLNVAELEAQVADLKKKVLGPGGAKHYDAYSDALDKLVKAKGLDKLKNLNSKEKTKVLAKTAQEKKEKKAQEVEWRKAQDVLDQRQRSVWKDLTSKDLDAIKDYTGESAKRSYTKLNGCLRKRLCLDLKARQHATHLDGALKKLPANTDGNEFYRGVAVNDKKGEALLKFLLNAKPGTKLKDPGFGSYSSKRAVAADFQAPEGPDGAKNILFVSRSKQLRPINTLSEIPTEYEALMPRGATSVIRKVTVQGSTLIVEVD